MTKRFWVSWECPEEDEGVDVLAHAGEVIDVWESGTTADGETVMACAVIDADSEQDVWVGVGALIGEYVERFCLEKPQGWHPGDRFPGGTGRTTITVGKQ